MKALIFSDSHGKYINMQKAIDMHMDSDYIIHLGDGLADLDNINPHNAQIIKTNGNFEDSFFSFGKNREIARVIELSNMRIFICHGHRHGVSGGIHNLINAIMEHDAVIALYGHTHIKHSEYISPSETVKKGIYVFNPGSISRPRDDIYSSFGLLEIKDGFVLLSHGIIK